MFEVRGHGTCPESPCSMKQLSRFVSRALLSFGCPSLLLVSVPCTICWGHDGKQCAGDDSRGPAVPLWSAETNSVNELFN